MVDELTPREIDVIRAILAGQTTTSELAAALVISERTVRCYINNIYAKTAATNRTHLVLMCLAVLPAPACLRKHKWARGE